MKVLPALLASLALASADDVVGDAGSGVTIPTDAGIFPESGGPPIPYDPAQELGANFKRSYAEHATRLRAAFGSELELEQQADYVYVNERNRGWWGNWADEWSRLQQLVCEIAAGRKMLAGQ